MLPLILTALIAASPPLDDDPAFKDAVTLYDDLELEQAVLRFQELALDADRPGEERARILAWLGLSYAQLGRFDDAKRNFELAVRAKADIELPRPAADKVRILLEDARKAAPAPEPAPAQVEPEAQPPATDTLDDKSEGEPEPASDDSGGMDAVVGGLKIAALGSAALAAAVVVIGASSAGIVVSMFYITNADPTATQTEVNSAEQTAATWPSIAGLTVVGASVPALAAGVLYGTAIILDE